MAESFRARLALSGLASMLARFFTVVSTFLCARLLSAQEFGRLSLWQTTLTSAIAFGTVGLGVATNSLIARSRHRDAGDAHRLVTTSIVIAFIAGLGCAVAVAFSAPVMSGVIAGSAHATSEVHWLALCVFFGGLNAVLVGIVSGLGSFKASATVNLINGALVLVGVTLGAELSGVRGVLTGLACASLVSGLCWLRVIVKACPGVGSFRYEFVSRREVRSLAGFALPSAFSAAVTAPAVWYGTLLLTHSHGGLAEAGFFGAALSWNNLVVFLQLAISPALVTSLAERRSAGDWPGYWAVFRKSVIATTVLSGGFALVIAMLSPFIMRTYGAAFEPRWPVLAWLMLSGSLSAVATTVANVIVTSGSMWWGALLNTIWALVFLPSALVLCPAYGATGLALAYVIAYGVHFVAVALFIVRFRISVNQSAELFQYQPGAVK
jgi:O-antigen/teichoic acid export membrane protein